MSELSPDVSARVAAVQAKLKEMGVKDLGFSRDADRWNAMTLDQRANLLCDIFEAMFAGKCKPAKMYDRPPPEASEKP